MSWLDFANHFLSKITCAIMDLTGLFQGRVFLVGNLALKVLAFSFSVILFSAAQKRRGHKDSVGNQEGDCFRHLKSWLLFFSFLLVTISYIIQTLFVPTTFLYVFLLLSSDLWSEIFHFLFAFLQSLIGNFLFFFCFPQIFDWGFSLFLLLFEAPSQLNSKWNFFLGAPSVLSVEGQGKSSYPGSRFMAEGLRFWLKWACGRPDVTYVRVFVWQAV